MRTRTVFLSQDEVTFGEFSPISERIPGYAGFRVNRNGVVLGRLNNRVLTRRQTDTGYYSVTIDGRQVRLGQILCHTFHGPPPSGDDVCVIHLDGPQTSTADRVRWGTRRESREVGKRRSAHLEARRARSKFKKERHG